MDVRRRHSGLLPFHLRRNNLNQPAFSPSTAYSSIGKNYRCGESLEGWRVWAGGQACSPSTYPRLRCEHHPCFGSTVDRLICFISLPQCASFSSSQSPAAPHRRSGSGRRGRSGKRSRWGKFLRVYWSP